MAYIGRQPTVGNFQICDAISTVNNQAAYTMQVGSVNVSPESANHMIVSLNGVIQKPTDAFTVSSSTITFASNLVTGDVIDFIQILGSVLDLGVPSDSTVSLAKLTATGTKNSTTFLRGDNTFAAAGLDGWSSSSGNLLPADASKGIYLGVNSATAANLLDDYEEGTFTPNDQSGASLNFQPNGQYTKVGSIVHFSININVPSNSSSANVSIGGLPFTVGDAQNADYYGGYITATNTNTTFVMLCSRNTTKINPQTLTNGSIANSTFSTKFFNFSGYYSIL